jgi:hypothetical protein
VRAFVCACAGFLLAVLWFDLMHDLQVLRPRPAADSESDEAVLSIARYYRRVTTDARPMNRLVALVMIATLIGIVAELANDSVPAWVAWTSLALATTAFSIAAARTVRNAVALGADVGALGERHRATARSIGRDHVVCLVLVATVLALQLAA